MAKFIKGQSIGVRSSASYDQSSNSCNNTNERSVVRDTVTSVTHNGVKTENSGFVHRSRIVQ